LLPKDEVFVGRKEQSTVKRIQARKIKERLSQIVLKTPSWGALGVLVLFVGIFSILNPAFFSTRNVGAMSTLAAELGIVTLGVTLLMIAGEFDLSVGSTYALAAFIFALLGNHIPSLLSFALALMVSGIIGFINAKITLKFGIPSFVTTLGMMMALRGIIMTITKGYSVAYTGDMVAPSLLGVLIGNTLFRPSHIWFVVLTLLMWFVLMRTKFGNWVFATGGDVELARALGIRTDRVKTICFVIAAVFAGLTGCIVMSRFRLATAAFGSGIELEAIAAAVIGGCSLRGGAGTIFGAFCGALLMSIIRNGLVLAGAPVYAYETFVGAIVVIAAIINQTTRRGGR